MRNKRNYMEEEKGREKRDQEGDSKGQKER
jgi:hypothetical protein